MAQQGYSKVGIRGTVDAHVAYQFHRKLEYTGCYRGSMQTNDMKTNEEAAVKTKEEPANDRTPFWIPGLAQVSALFL